jgi:hypothetical protein
MRVGYALNHTSTEGFRYLPPLKPQEPPNQLKVQTDPPPQIWLPGYIKDRLATLTLGRKPANYKRLWLLFADHYEPLWHGASKDTGAERVARWTTGWPADAAKSQDSAGRPPVIRFSIPRRSIDPTSWNQNLK